MFKNNNLIFSFFSSLKKIIVGDTIYKKIWRLYILLFIIGGICLYQPYSLKQQNQKFSFFDAFFTSISAFTNTGLVTFNTFETFSFVGQLIILILIQMGGMGFLTVLILLWNFLFSNSKFNFEQRLLMHFERGNSDKGASLQVVKTGIVVLLCTELLGAVFLTLFFYNATPLNIDGESQITFKGNWKQSIWAGIFHSVSASNNAGFDIIGKKSIMPYRADSGNCLSVIFFIQSFIGGIGYPVFYDFYKWLKGKRNFDFKPLNLFSKIALFMYFSISMFAIIVIILMEGVLSGEWLYNVNTNNWGKNPFWNKLWNLIYLVFSSRSAGFSGIEISELSFSTQWLLTLLMFVGASPASTGGGIRSVTFFIIIVKVLQIMYGRKNTTAFEKTINKNIVEESMVVFIVGLMLITVSALFIAQTGKNKIGIGEALFEASSAFGTAGLSVGTTMKTNYFGKILLLFLMFIGQLGISNALLSLTRLKPINKNIQYPTENLRII